MGARSLLNDTLVADPCTLTSGQPGPTAMEHEICPPACGTNCTPTGSVPPGSSVDGPPPVTTTKSPQVGTTSRMSDAVPGLEMVNPSCFAPPTVALPKSIVVSLNTHCAPGAWSAPAPVRSTGGMSAPSMSWQGESPVPVGV